MCPSMTVNHADGATEHSYSRRQSFLRLEDFVTFDNMAAAHFRARKGKRSRHGCFLFNQSIGANCVNYVNALLEGTYKPAPCVRFEIFCAAGRKKRIITAPTYSDGVVQHLFYKALYSIFDKGFIFDSYGCRKYKGTMKAANRTQQFVRQCPPDSYYLQIDIKKYYYTINHAILRESLERKIADKRIVDYLMMFADNEAGIGLQVGCLLSQLFGMIYLDRFDHFCKRVLKAKRYIRYVDDILFIGLTKDEAYEIKAQCEAFLKRELNLSLSKWKIQKLSRGINFVGMRTWHTHRLVRKRSLRTFNRALKRKRWASVSSVYAHALRTSTLKHLTVKLKQTVKESDYPHLDGLLARTLGVSREVFKRAKRNTRRCVRKIINTFTTEESQRMISPELKC